MTEPAIPTPDTRHPIPAPPDWPALHARRQANWCQTPEARIAAPDAAVPYLERVGMATLFPASPEVPDLYHAHMGDPEVGTDSKWDSPSGYVYTWRWDLGRCEAGFYTALVRKKPTWISWSLLPVVLRLCGEMRPAEDLYAHGLLSADAVRVARALAASGGVLTTGDLRREAGFPTGKEQRAAYLKAVEELDTRLMLAKVFSTDDEDMRHALVAIRFPAQSEEAAGLSREHAMERFLTVYLSAAVYVLPGTLAKHVGVAEADMRAALDRMAHDGRVVAVTHPEAKGACYTAA